MSYTKEELIAQNSSYNYDHRVTDDDVTKVNGLIERLEAQAMDGQVHAGDVVVLLDKDDKVKYISAHLEKDWSDINDWMICTQAYVPFVNPSTLGMNASGGYWLSTKTEKLQYIGKRRKAFCVWGHCGGCANGAVEFTATVNLWLLKNERIY